MKERRRILIPGLPCFPYFKYTDILIEDSIFTYDLIRLCSQIFFRVRKSAQALSHYSHVIPSVSCIIESNVLSGSRGNCRSW